MDFTGSNTFEELLKRSHEFGSVTITDELMDVIKKEILADHELRFTITQGLWKDIAYARLGRHRNEMPDEHMEIIQAFLEHQ